MTTRRNAFDNDILADLGINTAPSAPQTTLPNHRSDAAPARQPEAPARTRRIGVDVTEELWTATKIIAAQEGTTVAEIVRSHLRSLVAGQ